MVMHLPGYPTFLVKWIPLLLLQVAASLSFLLVAYFMADAFNKALGTEGGEMNIPESSNIDLSDDKVVGAMFFLAAATLLGPLTPFFSSLLINNLKASLQVDQATRVVAQVFALPHDSMISTPTGEFAQLIGKVFQSDGLVGALYTCVFPTLLETLIAFIFLLCAYGWIALLQLFLFLAYTLLSYRLAATSADETKKSMAILMSEWGKIMGVESNYEVAHFFGNVDAEVARARASFQAIQAGIQKFQAINWGEVALKAFGLTMSLALLGCVLFLLDSVSTVELVALGSYFFRFVAGLAGYGTVIKQLRSSIAEFQALNDFFERVSETADIAGAVELPPPHSLGCDVAPPEIEFDRVCFSYGGKQILDDVSFVVRPGQTVGLVGGSGCGKSTCLRLLLRLYKPTSGVIRVDGHDIRTITGSSLRRLFSVVTQDPKIFNGTLRENIGYGRAGASNEEILKAANMAELNLEEIAAQAEGGGGGGPVTIDEGLVLDKLCGEGGAKLSGGQQQRVAIARAMLKNGSVYLLDEPTTGLDNMVAHQIQKTLERLGNDIEQGCDDGYDRKSFSKATTICITHHLHELRKASEIFYLQDGKIVESGTFEELVARNDGIFAAQIRAKADAMADAKDHEADETSAGA